MRTKQPLVWLLGLLPLLTHAQIQWKNGLRIKTEQGSFKLGGRIHYDINAHLPDDSVQAAIGPVPVADFDFRRLRIYHSGKLYHNRLHYKVQLDFAGGKVKFKDVYIAFHFKPWWLKTLRIGQFKTPFRFEALTSSNHILLIERSTLSELTPIRTTGLLWQAERQRWGWQTGLFFNAHSNGNAVVNSNEINALLRLAGLPLYQPDQKRWVLIAAHGGTWMPSKGLLQWKIRPPVHTFPKIVHTPQVKNISQMLSYGGELALGWGPLTVQAEWLTYQFEGTVPRMVNEGGIPVLRDVVLRDQTMAYYAQLAYVLTGEHHALKGLSGGLKGIKPRKSWGNGGLGAVELVARYEQADLRVADGGAVLTSYVAGLNWYLTSALKVKINYVLTHWQPVGIIQAVGVRTQLVF